ncbi:hypothetical protein BJ741DRAFT_653151 [Chytriomyces cf. hyalinus JEL632]|nr:hypothetical protein BJ741DRAFT_653151 [Chytriomyces cf. hyalinus JEL632]
MPAIDPSEPRVSPKCSFETKKTQKSSSTPKFNDGSTSFDSLAAAVGLDGQSLGSRKGSIASNDTMRQKYDELERDLELFVGSVEEEHQRRSYVVKTSKDCSHSAERKHRINARFLITNKRTQKSSTKWAEYTNISPQTRHAITETLKFPDMTLVQDAVMSLMLGATPSSPPTSASTTDSAAIVAQQQPEAPPTPQKFHFESLNIPVTKGLPLTEKETKKSSSRIPDARTPSIHVITASQQLVLRLRLRKQSACFELTLETWI